MRFIFFFVGLLLAPIARAGDVDILHVWPTWREADYFERIGEYFGRPESPGRETFLRTQPTERAGYYFLVRAKKTTALTEIQCELSVIRPDSPDPKQYRFPVTLRSKETVFQVGLTGTDWPAGEKANPVAWKIALLAPDGRVLTEHKSFLWEKPGK